MKNVFNHAVCIAAAAFALNGCQTKEDSVESTVTYNGDADLWRNTATLTVASGAGSVVVEYRRAGDTQWHTAKQQGGGDYIIEPEYTDVPATDGKLAYKSLVDGTGVWLGNSYEVRVTVDGREAATTAFDAGGTKDIIPDGTMDNWSKHHLDGVVGGDYDSPNTDPNNPFWSNGNNSLTKDICQESTIDGCNGKACALLKSAESIVLAAGNLFSGEMVVEGFGAYPNFGRKYTYTARPSAFRFRYRATITPITTVGSSDTLHQKGDPDPASVMFAIVDWNATHVIASGMAPDANTFFNPAQKSAYDEGNVIGYGLILLTESKETWTEVTIPVCWYDTAAGNPSGNTCSIVISAASSAYGDYLTGSPDNELYIEDFEWVY